MPERSCLTTALKKGIELCNTCFINIVQEDLILIRKFDLDSIINSIKTNKHIDLVRYNKDTNLETYNCTIRRCKDWSKYNSKMEIKKTININGLILTRSNQYSDNCHITTKEFYEKYIFPNVNNYDFMEHSIMCEVGNIIPDTLWNLGRYNDGNFIKNLDGRRA